jgi:hypothetical protein
MSQFSRAIEGSVICLRAFQGIFPSFFSWFATKKKYDPSVKRTSSVFASLFEET